MKVFYHHDADGHCAAFWVRLSATTNRNNCLNAKEEDFIEIDYGIPFPFERIAKDETVWILDYSIPPAEMNQLFGITEDVTWIDHHKTAIAAYSDYPREIRGIRTVGIAGCVLTYLYLHHMTNKGEGPIRPFSDEDVLNVPYFTALIGDRDVWAFKYGDASSYFSLGLFTYDWSLASNIWQRMLADHYDHTDLVNNIIEKGKIINIYCERSAARYVQQYAGTVMFEGIRTVAVNHGRISIEFFKNVSDQGDIYLGYAWDPKLGKYRVAMRSSTVDVSVIARKYGGGGHKNAAGFETKELPF